MPSRAVHLYPEDRVAPALPSSELLPVAEPLAALFPDHGLRRGTLVTLSPAQAGSGGSGATSLALALVAAASAAGSWVAVVGADDLGAVAAAEVGVELSRLALVPRPGSIWPTVTSALLDAFDLVVLCPPGRVKATDGSRLTARARQRRSVLVVLDVGTARGAWSEAPAVALTVAAGTWTGLGQGHGHLRSRRVEVTAIGRGAARRPRHAAVWLPGR